MLLPNIWLPASILRWKSQFVTIKLPTSYMKTAAFVLLERQIEINFAHLRNRRKVCQLVTFVCVFFIVHSWVCESVKWSIITWEIKANVNLCPAMSVAHFWDANVAQTEHVKRVTRHSICPLICTSSVSHSFIGYLSCTYWAYSSVIINVGLFAVSHTHTQLFTATK